MRKMSIYFGLLMVMLGLLVWKSWPSLRPEVVICDVGQGDGMIITQGFSQMVIDVGRANGAMADCLGSTLPFWDKEIEMLVITHADSDHSGGLKQVMEAYTVDTILTSEKTKEIIQQELSPSQLVLIATMGQVWTWGVVQSEVMWPPPLATLPKAMTKSTNDTGIVLRLVFDNKDSVWMAADTGEKVEQMLVEMGKVKPTTVLKVSHHGSKYATTNRFVGILRPRYFVVSVGKNSYGHPSVEVLSRIEEFGGLLWRTDLQGTWRWIPE